MRLFSCFNNKIISYYIIIIRIKHTSSQFNISSNRKQQATQVLHRPRSQSCVTGHDKMRSGTDLRGGSPLVNFNHVIDTHFVTLSSCLFRRSATLTLTLTLLWSLIHISTNSRRSYMPCRSARTAFCRVPCVTPREATRNCLAVSQRNRASQSRSVTVT